MTRNEADRIVKFNREVIAFSQGKGIEQAEAGMYPSDQTWLATSNPNFFDYRLVFRVVKEKPNDKQWGRRFTDKECDDILQNIVTTMRKIK